MKKAEQINEIEKDFGKFFNDKFKELQKSKFLKRDELKDIPGIYVFYKGDDPIYVGRSDKIKERVQLHTRPGSHRGSATFAFFLAKKDYLEKYKEIKLNMAELEKDKKFIPFFKDQKKYLSDCKFKVLEENNDVLQTMLEPYIAYELGTYPKFNTFKNH